MQLNDDAKAYIVAVIVTVYVLAMIVLLFSTIHWKGICVPFSGFDEGVRPFSGTVGWCE